MPSTDLELDRERARLTLLRPEGRVEFEGTTYEVVIAGSYGSAYQFIFCMRTPTFVEVLGVAGAVPQLPGLSTRIFPYPFTCYSC